MNRVLSWIGAPFMLVGFVMGAILWCVVTGLRWGFESLESR